MKTLFAFSILLSLTQNPAFADRVSGGDSSAPFTVSIDQGKRKPSVQELYSCADSSAENLFSRNGQSSIRWNARPGYISEPLAPVAVSVVAQGGVDRIITITPNKIFSTNVKWGTHEWDGVEKASQLTLDLNNRIDPKNGLPVVDSRDSISPSWAEGLIVSRGGNGWISNQREFEEPRYSKAKTAIKADDALTGDKADQAIQELNSTLRSRIKETNLRVRDIAKNLLESSKHSYRWDMRSEFDTLPRKRDPNEFYLTQWSVQTIREGLCNCQSLFVDEVDQVIRELTDPKKPIEIYDTKQKQKRILTPADFGCGMV